MAQRLPPHRSAQVWVHATPGKRDARPLPMLEDPNAEVFQTMARCFAILQGHVREAEQTSASAVLDMTDRLRDVHKQCQRLQQDWDRSARDFGAMLGTADSPLGQQLQAMTAAMNATMQGIRDDLLNALGQMQFQDINRQLLEQVDHSLGNLGEHCHAQCDPQQEPPSAADLEAIVADWMSHYVMDAQRRIHIAHSRPGDTGPPEPDNPIRIELF